MELTQGAVPVAGAAKAPEAEAQRPEALMS